MQPLSQRTLIDLTAEQCESFTSKQSMRGLYPRDAPPITNRSRNTHQSLRRRPIRPLSDCLLDLDQIANLILEVSVQLR